MQYAAQAAAGLRTVRIAGVESELQLGFAALHRLLVPLLDRIDGLPAPQRNGLGSTFGLPPVHRRTVSWSAWVF